MAQIDSFDDTHSITLVGTAPGASQRVLKTGQVIGGSYRLKSLLGKGGMGYVFCAQHVMIGRDYALKIVAPEILNEGTKKRFESEGRAIAQLDHANIVKVYNMGLHEGDCPFYVMDLLEGEALSDYLAANPNVSFSLWLDIFMQVACGLAYAHGKGLVHRDVKPSNIILIRRDRGGHQVKIVDFGLAKFVQSADQYNQSLTAAGAVLGSPLYMSPEQTLGDAVDLRSDIYSLGCTFYECLSGRPPYRGKSVMQTLLMHQENAVPNILETAKGEKLPEGFAVVLGKMMAKRPENRYQSMEQVVHDLERLRQGKVVGAGASHSEEKLKVAGAASRYFRTAGGGDKRVAGSRPGGSAGDNGDTGDRRSLILKMIAAGIACILLVAASYFVYQRFAGEQPISDTVKRVRVEPEVRLEESHWAFRNSGDIESQYETINGVVKRVIQFPSALIGQVYYQAYVSAGDGRLRVQPVLVEAKGRVVVPADCDLGLIIGDAGSGSVLADCDIIGKVGPNEFAELTLKRTFVDAIAAGTEVGATNILEFASKWHKLRQLKITGLPYNKPMLAAIDNIQTLKTLLLESSKWVGVNLGNLKCLSRLRYFYVDDAPLVPGACSALAHNNSLESLGLFNCQVTAKKLLELRNCRNLRDIELREPNINALVPAIVGLHTLRTVRLHNGALRPEEIDAICACPNIVRLSLSGWFYKREQQKVLHARFPKLVFEKLDYPGKIEKIGPAKTGKSGTVLPEEEEGFRNFMENGDKGLR